MAREHQINEDPTLPVKVVALSIIGLWVAYFLLTTLRGFILSYELQQAFGLDLQQEMLWRRAVVCMGGVAVTTVMWLLLRLTDLRAMWVKITAALLLALPAAGLIAQINQVMFLPVQEQINQKVQEREFNRLRPKDTGGVLDDVGARSEEFEEAMAEEQARREAELEQFQWLGLLDMAVSRYFLFLSWAALYLAMFAGSQARAAERRGERFRSAAKAAELRSLRYQVNPHFLFNSLNSLSALVMTGKPERAEEMIQAMSSFYRHSLAVEPTSDVALADEFALQAHYLEIESVRFPERLIPVFDLPGELSDARIPGMILQPLIENSVKYGVAPVTRPVTITVAAREDYGRLAVTVCDDGPGADGLGEPGFGIGLTNVRDRLEALFGKEASITSGPTEAGYCTEIRLPLRKHG
ncbi:sensor histidine kinase [Erythrobacter sp. HKB08]|uniref:sensor histidine kinase n=1 Tax=Erythrobacter sp. HKB08 TaxID=2502843 RepID=UPI0010092752|nr:histidine kinase [Erythrobacter sp. HKB08]